MSYKRRKGMDLRKSSDWMIESWIKQADCGTPNDLPIRKTEWPFHMLEVGQSVWFDRDKCEEGLPERAKRAASQYNDRYEAKFKAKNHRGNCVCGYQFVEIARIK